MNRKLIERNRGVSIYYVPSSRTVCKRTPSKNLYQVQSESTITEINEFRYGPHEMLLGILRVSNPATRKDLADWTWGGSGTNPR